MTKFDLCDFVDELGADLNFPVSHHEAKDSMCFLEAIENL
jgi:hypothetical protein